MIRTLSLKNFRCFENLYLRELKRFNVIVGQGGSGKTALLEAIFLLSAASPEVWMRLRQWRGSSPQFRLTGTRSSYESLFRDIFYNFDKHKPVKMELVDSNDRRRSLSISYPRLEIMVRSAKVRTEPTPVSEENAYLVEPIEFEWRSKSRIQKARVEIKDGILQFRGGNNVYPVWFSSPVINEASLIAQSFSDLSIRKKADTLVNAVKKLYPDVLDLSVESIAGDLALCMSSASTSEKLPVGVMSSGMTRFLSIMIAIANNPNGVLLIDEMEVGFYYKTLPMVLSSIFSFCEEHNVQIFASTHSYEFMQALVPFMKEREGTDDAFLLLRAEKKGPDSSIKPLENPAAAIASNFEVR
jgi:predicted ATPase